MVPLLEHPGFPKQIEVGSSNLASSYRCCQVNWPLGTRGGLRLVERHNLRPHIYADDTQIYGFCRPTAASQLQQQVSVCIDDVALWMQSNRLQLNTAKTEVLWCAWSRRQHQLPQVALRVGIDYVTPTTSVNNIGIYVNSDVSMQTYMSMPGMCPADSLYYASCTAFVSR